LHAVLAVAACLVGWPWPARWLAVAIVGAHGWWRWPERSPAALLVAADGTCRAPQWGPEVYALGPRTRFTRFGAALDLGTGPHRRRLLVVFDQVPADDWRRLEALLRRAKVK
jgi:hypothetical protein